MVNVIFGLEFMGCVNFEFNISDVDSIDLERITFTSVIFTGNPVFRK